MKCFMIVNKFDEVVYVNYDSEFVRNLEQIIIDHDLNQIMGTSDLNTDILMKIFCPFLTSQKAMHSQFGNAYSYIQCYNDLVLVFDRFINYFFISIGSNKAETEHVLEIGYSLAKHVCAFDMAKLRYEKKSNYFSYLFNRWLHLSRKDQSIKMEAVEKILVNMDLTNTAVSLLRDICNMYQKKFQWIRVHALFFVRYKLLALYSSEPSRTILPSDILFLMLFIHDSDQIAQPEDQDDGDDFLKKGSDDCMRSLANYAYLLSPKMHFSPFEIIRKDLTKNLHIFILVELPVDSTDSNYNLNICLSHFNTCLNSISWIIDVLETMSPPCRLPIHREPTTLIEKYELIKTKFEVCHKTLKKIRDYMKKLKCGDISKRYHNLQKAVDTKWDYLRKVFNEWSKLWQTPSQNIFSIWSQQRKNVPEEALISGNEYFHQLDDNMAPFFDQMKTLLNVVMELSLFKGEEEHVKKRHRLFEDKIVGLIEQRLNVNYGDYFQVKSLSNIPFDAYLSEFPGLIHFAYIDRFNHQLFAPEINTTTPTFLSKKHFWSMIDQCKDYLKHGFTTVSWKDNYFTYSYFLWFENLLTGAKISPDYPIETFSDSKLRPGLKNDDYYSELVNCCFPKIGSAKVCCYELYLVHLYLTESSVILEQARRLSVNIWDFVRLPKGVDEIY